MYGELHDYHYPNSPEVYDRYTTEAGYILQTALGLLGFYYIILRGFNILPVPTKENLSHFDETGLT